MVAFIGPGINYNHRDVAANMWRNPGEIPGNGIDDDSNGWVDDVHGIDIYDGDSDPMEEPSDPGPNQVSYYGTGSASLVGAVGNDSFGMAGLNWQVQLMAIRVSWPDGRALNTDTVQGLDYVLRMKQRGINVRAVNIPYVWLNFFSAMKDAIDVLGDAGVVVVCALGIDGLNNDLNPSYPASYDSPNLIAVASASYPGDQFDIGSRYGPSTVHLTAPGHDILTAWGPEPNRLSAYQWPVGRRPACQRSDCLAGSRAARGNGIGTKGGDPG